MNKTCRILRTHLEVLLLLLLPFGGFLYGISSHQEYAWLIALVCLALAICIESVNQLTLREAGDLNAQLKVDRKEFEAWTDRVKELDRIETRIATKNEQTRQKLLELSAHGPGGVSPAG